MDRVLKLLESLGRKELVGTLLIGQKERNSEVFLEERLLYLVTDRHLEKIDLDGLAELGVLGQKASETTLETVIIGTDLSRTILAEALRSRNLIDENECRALAQRHFREELCERLQSAGDSFLFQEAYVPDSIIGRNSLALQCPVPIDALLEVLRQRLADDQRFQELMPDEDEVFVLTEKGMAQKQAAAADFGLQRIFDLIDGFRNLRSIIGDSYFFGFYIRRRIAESLEAGWIKKTLMPEVRNIDPDRLSSAEAARYVPLYKTAIRYGVDEVIAREGLARLMIRLGRNEEAVNQYNFIGDTLFRMGRKAKALRAYFQALALKTDDPMVIEKVVRIYHAEAEERLRNGNVGEAVQLYLNAIEVHPDSALSYQALFKVLAEHRDLARIAELCDQAAARSRISGNPDLAIDILRRAIALQPAEALFSKKLINLLLDRQRTAEALDEMERLAQLYADSGRPDQGAILIDKILRADSSRKHLWERSRTPPVPVRQAARAFWSRLALRAALVSALFVTLYQLWTWRRFEVLRRESFLAHASADWFAPSRPGGGVAASNTEIRLKGLAARAAVFEKRHPLSVFGFAADRLRREFDAAVSRLQADRIDRRERVLDSGLTHLATGDKQRAEEVLGPLLQLPAEDPWREKAAAALQKSREYEDKALQVLQKAEKALAVSDWETAHRQMQTLTSLYPLASAARKAVFPIEVASVPAGATLRWRRGRSAAAPAVVQLPPGAAEEVSVELPGFETREVTIECSSGPRLVVHLRQVPLWSAEERRFERQAPLIKDAWLFAITDKGHLQALGLADGAAGKTFASGDLIQPLGAPLDCGPYILLALNNGQLLRFHSDLRQDGGFQVKGLLSLAPLLLESGFQIAFATTQLQLLRFDPLKNLVFDAITLELPAAHLVAAGADEVIGVDSMQAVFRASFAQRRRLWRQPMAGAVLAPPIVLRGAEPPVVLVVSDGGQLSALEAASGALLWTHELECRPLKVGFIEASGRLVIAPKQGPAFTVNIASRERRPLPASSPLANGFERFERLDGRLGLFKADGSFHFLDPQTLAPLWSLIPGRPQARPAAASRRGEVLAIVDGEGTLRLFRLPAGI